MSYKSQFLRHMDNEGIRYDDLKEFVVKITYNGDNLESIPVLVFFDEDNDPIVQLKCWNIANFKGKEEIGYEVCNRMNNQWRWVKFYIDDDADIVASIDAYIDMDTCGEECLNLVRRVVNITDEAYPEFAKARWA